MEIIANKVNEKLNIAFIDLWNVYLLPDLKLIPESYKGELTYRIPKKSTRISYKNITKDLKKKQIIIRYYCPF